VLQEVTFITTFNLHYTYGFSSYRAVNTPRLGYLNH